MATISMASFPHIETNVLDESISRSTNTRVLPLQRDIFVTRAQKGLVGVPSWFDQYVDIETAHGSETFNELNAKYFSNDSLFIKRVAANNGCFVVRLAEPETLSDSETVTHDGISERNGALKALQILEAVVNSGNDFAGTNIVLYERNSDGTFMTDEDGVKIEYKLDATGNHIPPYTLDSNGERLDADATSPDNAAWIAIPNTQYYIAGTTGDGTAGVKTVKGIKIDWRWRYAYQPIGASGRVERETTTNMKSYVEGSNTVYPMIVFEASSPGSWGDDNCLEFFYASENNSRDEAQYLGNLQYTLKPHFKEYGSSSVSSYFDINGNNAVKFVMEPNKVDDRYTSMISFTDILTSNYDSANPKPWNVTCLNDNWELVGKLAKKFELQYYIDTYDAATSIITLPDGSTISNLAGDGIADADTDGVVGVDSFVDNKGNTLDYINMSSAQRTAYTAQTAYYNAVSDYTNPWMMNIVSGVNLDVVPYYAVVVNGSDLSEPSIDSLEDNDDGTKLFTYLTWRNADLVSDVLHYAQNGRDGSLTDWDHEERVRQFYALTYQYSDTWNPKNIVDRGRYPFNFVFDTGYTFQTKKALCDFLVTREDVKVILSTQNCNKYLSASGTIMNPRFNTIAEDESIGTALQSRIQLMRESVIKGTSCCRATIYANCGYIYGTYKNIVPLTLWSAIKGSQNYNTTTMKGSNKGWPNSKMDIFKELNYVAPDNATHERQWNIGINYVQYYDMDNLHFPSIRTVYKYDTSVLLDDEFTDTIVFVKQAARDSWATYVGMDTEQAVYEALIVKDLTARLMEIFNGRYSFTVEAYQTAEEKNRGYVQHVVVNIISGAVKRVWLVDVVCRREGLSSASTTTTA